MYMCVCVRGSMVCIVHGCDIVDLVCCMLCTMHHAVYLHAVVKKSNRYPPFCCSCHRCVGWLVGVKCVLFVLQPVVMDVGSGWAKMGLAGQDKPSCVFPSVVGRMDLRAYDRITGQVL